MIFYLFISLVYWKVFCIAINELPSDILCESYPRPNVAYCLIGLSRTFSSKNVYVTLRKNMIEGFGGNASLFISLQVSNDNELETLSPALLYLKDLIVDHSIYYDKQTKKFDKNANASLGSIYFEDPNYVNKVLAQYDNVKRCYESVENYEKKSGFKFDWIMKVRSDVVYFQAVPPFCLYNPKFVRTARGSNDVLNLIPRDLGSPIFNFVDYYYDMRGSFNIVNAEELLSHFFRMKNITMLYDSNLFINVRRQHLLTKYGNMHFHCPYSMKIKFPEDDRSDRISRCIEILQGSELANISTESKHDFLNAVEAYCKNYRDTEC